MSDVSAEGTPATAPDPEDRARANLYGLISRLFFAPADPNLLAEISRASEAAEGGGVGDGGISAAWRTMQEACRGAYPAVVRQEYESLFQGVGKPEVSPYLSGYAEPSGPDRYVVSLRKRLSDWGLGRREGVFEVEDHISGVSDVMRWLIENGHSVADQKQFFETFAYPGAQGFCIAVQNATSANFYKKVAALLWAFMEIEKAAFEMAGSN